MWKPDVHKLNSGVYLPSSHHHILFINLWAVIFRIYCFIVVNSWHFHSCKLHAMLTLTLLCSVICLQICHAVKSQGYVPVRDPEGRIGPYAYKGNQWVSYDDVSDIRRKVRALQVVSFCSGVIMGCDTALLVFWRWVQEKVICLGTLNTCKWWQHIPLKCVEPCTHWCSITSQMTRPLKLLFHCTTPSCFYWLNSFWLI